MSTTKAAIAVNRFGAGALGDWPGLSNLYDDHDLRPVKMICAACIKACCAIPGASR